MLILVQSVFGKENSVFASEPPPPLKNMVVGLQVYPGHKTPSTLVEDTSQYLPYKYTPFKDESDG